MKRNRLFFGLLIGALLVLCLAMVSTAAGNVTVFKFYTADGSAASDDGFTSPVAKKIEEATGVRLQLDYPIGSAGVDKLQLMVASGDYPDLIHAKGDLTLLKEAGALIPLDDLIEQYAPNLKAAYGENLARLRWSKDDPHIYCLGAWGTGTDAVVDVDGGFMIQHRVVQELGYPELRTIEDFENAIVEYYKKHPITDGLPTIPITLIADDWRTVISVSNPAFQATGAPDDGEYYVDPETLQVMSHYKRPVEREYFRWLNGLWNKGILDRETFVQKYDTYKAKIATGRVLALIDADWDIMEPLAALRQAGKYEYLYGRYPITVSEDIQQCPPDVDAGYTGGWGIAITTACKDPVKAIQFLDWMVTEEACVLRHWGIEGEHWTYDENGRRVFLPEVDKARKEDPSFSRKTGIGLYGYPFPRLPNNHIDSTGNYIVPDMSVEDIRATYNEVEKEVLSNYGVNIWKDLFPAQDTYPTKVWGYLWMVAIDDPTIDVINQKAWDYTLKTVPQIVMAPADQFDKAYDDFLAGLDELGVQKVEEFYTKKIQENLELWSM
ncbi:MAG: ABC transporter substrate-binding protein [Bacillota bacterium]